jgi:ubiquinone/menaquinone biosynthesis C-methylase UbiE
MPPRPTALPVPRTPVPPATKARFWDRVARQYAADPIADMAGYETTLRRVAALLTPAQRVREIGCGTGTTALRLAAGTREWVATDVSSGMIAIAREKLAAQPLPQLRFEVADAEAPVAAGAGHDAVLAFNVLHLVTDLEVALAAVVGALKPGGRLISKTPCLAEMNPLVPRVLVPLMRLIGKAPAVLVFDAAQLQAAFERHGLAIEAVERHGTQRKDIRVFIVARKAPTPTVTPSTPTVIDAPFQ